MPAEAKYVRMQVHLFRTLLKHGSVTSGKSSSAVIGKAEATLIKIKKLRQFGRCQGNKYRNLCFLCLIVRSYGVVHMHRDPDVGAVSRLLFELYLRTAGG